MNENNQKIKQFTYWRNVQWKYKDDEEWKIPRNESCQCG